MDKISLDHGKVRPALDEAAASIKTIFNKYQLDLNEGCAVLYALCGLVAAKVDDETRANFLYNLKNTLGGTVSQIEEQIK